jgi:hypothetical protein
MRVLIIESPSLEDITSGDREGEHLHALLGILRLNTRYYPIHSDKLLGKRLGELALDHDDLHIAAHGDENGLGFTDTSRTTWKELSTLLGFAAGNKLVVVSSCHSSKMPKPDGTLGAELASILGVDTRPPRAVLTFFSTVFYYDCVLAWGIFYRHLTAKLTEHKSQIASCEARWIWESLKAVKGASLPSVKICASFWYEQYRKHVDISPWHEDAEANLEAMSIGTSSRSPRY